MTSPSKPGLNVLIDQKGGGRAQRRPEEKRARLLAAARVAFAKSGYGASVHEICQAAGVGIGTFYHQFPDKSDLMRFLMDEEHQYRVREFDSLGRWKASGRRSPAFLLDPTLRWFAR